MKVFSVLLLMFAITQSASALVETNDVEIKDAWSLSCNQVYNGRLATDSSIATYNRHDGLGVMGTVGSTHPSSFNGVVSSVQTLNGGGNDIIAYTVQLQSASGALFSGVSELAISVNMREQFKGSQAYKALILTRNSNGQPRLIKLSTDLFCEFGPR